MYHWKQCSVGNNVKLGKWISYGRFAFSSLHDSSKYTSFIVLGKRKPLPTCAWQINRTTHVFLWHTITTCEVICLPALFSFSVVKHSYRYNPTFCSFPWFSYFANFFLCIFFQYALRLLQPVRTKDKTCLQDYFLNHFIVHCTVTCQYNCCQSNVVTCHELLGKKRDTFWENIAEGIKALDEPNTTMNKCSIRACSESLPSENV